MLVSWLPLSLWGVNSHTQEEDFIPSPSASQVSALCHTPAKTKWTQPPPRWASWCSTAQRQCLPWTCNKGAVKGCNGCLDESGSLCPVEWAKRTKHSDPQKWCAGWRLQWKSGCLGQNWGKVGIRLLYDLQLNDFQPTRLNPYHRSGGWLIIFHDSVVCSSETMSANDNERVNEKKGAEPSEMMERGDLLNLI